MSAVDAPVADWVTIPELYRDPFPTYERLRAEGGVHWVPAVNRYLITSYDAVHETELDQTVYSANEEGSLQIRAMGHSMLRRDDPEHMIERRAWQPALRPGAVKRVWRQVFQEYAEMHLRSLIEKGPGADLIWDFAAPFAGDSLRRVIGLYNATHEDLQRWSQQMIDATGNYADDPGVWALGEQAFNEVDAALDEMLAWQAQNPDDSLISQLLRLPDYRMPLDKIRVNVKMTIGGGMNEPRDALGVATWALLTHPEQRSAVEADPTLWPTVFEETIRWVAPIGMYSRQTTREVELTGVRLPRGARLGICLLSANRDTSVWPGAERFDIHRTAKPHLAFGKGVHVCLGAWVARSEVADVALPLLFNTLEGLELDPSREPEIGGWVFRGMTSLPITWRGVSSRRAEPARVAATPRVAVVGSGPSGCFSAQSLLRTFPGAQIDVFDTLPTPYGLVRYGVAADHQGTKSVTRQFDRLYASRNVRFHGNTHIGRDVALDDLREAFDVVVLASGVHTDSPLPIPGADHAGVIGAGHLTRLLNTHPDTGDLPPLQPEVAVIGHGNVAMDVARLLARDTDDFDGSDLHDEAHTTLTNRVRTIHLIGRSQPQAAKFDPVMVRELAGLSGVHHVVHSDDLTHVPDGKDARVDAVRSLATGGSDDAARVTIHWWFGYSPDRIDADGDTITALQCSNGTSTIAITAGNVITAIGFQGDDASPVAPGSHPDGRVTPGLYVAGWLRRGPRGTIPDQRTDSLALASLIANDISAGEVTLKQSCRYEPRAGATDFDGWRRIDLLERLGAAPGRERSKMRTTAKMLEAAGDLTLALPDVAAGTGAALATRVPATIAFATESGGAELVAEELAQAITGDVDLLDLSHAAPADLDPGRFLILIASTYGDGEIPSGALPFYEALQGAGGSLAGLRYSVFGMGDRSYDRTYSRGSELLSEALEAAGATRVGEYGRHDAGGPEPATDAALDWVVAVVEEAGSIAVG